MALQASGYNVICLPADDREAVNVGLRFVNNDACYPAIISKIGQLIEALQSGKYDLQNTSVFDDTNGRGMSGNQLYPAAA